MILITGATGNNGVEILNALSEHNEKIRAMVRRIPDGKAPFPTNVQAVVADFDDAPSLHNALTGVNRAFLVTPSSEKVEEQQLRFIDVARQVGVEHIVYLSQLHASLDSPVRFLRYHARIEQKLLASGMRFTHLRPNLYMQGLLMFRQSIQSQGQILAPIGDARVSLVDVRDIAALAVAALTQSGHGGRTYDITGPEALTHAEIAQILAEELNVAVQFVNIPAPAFLKTLLDLKMPTWQAEGLVEDYAHYGRGEASDVSADVQSITGVPPRSFRSFVREYSNSFVAPS